MENKTERKNKTGQIVNYPDGYFTLKQLFALNPEMVEITLRVRLKNAIRDKSIAVIGDYMTKKGRPELILTKTPVSTEVLNSTTKDENIRLLPNMETLVTVVQISKTTPMTINNNNNNNNNNNVPIDNNVVSKEMVNA